jgi:hypothetical protein
VANPVDGAAEVELLRCDYAARCARAGCRQYHRATTIVRYLDNQGRPLRQFEVCDGFVLSLVHFELQSAPQISAH